MDELTDKDSYRAAVQNKDIEKKLVTKPWHIGVFCSLTDRPTDHGSYILDAH